MPDTICNKNVRESYTFIKKNKKIVIKPIHVYAGKNSLFIDRKLNSKILNKYIKKFDHVMVQKYLSKVKEGDKRVFIINGKVKGAIRRLPKKNSILSNIYQGWTALQTKWNYSNIKISNLFAEKIKKSRIFIAGIDLNRCYLIGDIDDTYQWI